MRLTIKIFIILLISIPVLAQVSLSVSVGSEYYENNDYNYSSTYSINPFYSGDKIGDFGFNAAFNQTAVNIQSPVSTKNVNIKISDYTFEYGYPIVENFYSLFVKPQIGIGIRNIVKDGYTISLGALGEREIPLADETFFLANGGLLISLKIFDRVSFFIQPRIAVYNIDKVRRSYAFNGGISIVFK